MFKSTFLSDRGPAWVTYYKSALRVIETVNRDSPFW